MAKKVKKQAKEKVDPNVVEEYYEEYSFMCPKRGKVIQQVKVKRFKAKDTGSNGYVAPSQDVVEKLEEEDKLSIYSTEEMERGGDEE